MKWAKAIVCALFGGKPEPTEAEQAAVLAVLPGAGAEDVARLARAARGGDARRVQAELVEAGVRLSAAPPTAYELLRRFGMIMACLLMAACGGTEPAPSTPSEGGDAGAPNAPPVTEKPTVEQLMEWCVQVGDSDSTCKPEPSSACRYDRGEVYMPRGCACDAMFCARPAAFETTNYPGHCCRAP